MKKLFVVVFIALSVILGMFASTAHAGLSFSCSVCGSNSHGSMWHDSDKDGINDR